MVRNKPPLPSPSPSTRRSQTTQTHQRRPRPDRKTRTAALTSLRTFLGAKHIATALTTLDVLKLWKGLFYALWMCDRPLPQQQLCADLSSGLLLGGVFPENDDGAVVRAWLRGFWATMAREWTTGIDVLRMEKFLLLVRRMLGASLVWARRRAPPTGSSKKAAGARKKRAADGAEKKATAAATAEEEQPRWDERRVEVVLALLADWPLRPDEETKDAAGEEEEEDGELMPKFVPAGLKLHVLDIWVDEADKAGLIEESEAEAEDEEKKKAEEGVLPGRVVLERINELVEKLNAETRSTAVRIRSKESLADDRLPWNKKEGGNDGEDGEWGGLDD